VELTRIRLKTSVDGRRHARSRPYRERKRAVLYITTVIIVVCNIIVIRRPNVVLQYGIITQTVLSSSVHYIKAVAASAMWQIFLQCIRYCRVAGSTTRWSSVSEGRQGVESERRLSLMSEGKGRVYIICMYFIYTRGGRQYRVWRGVVMVRAVYWRWGAHFDGNFHCPTSTNICLVTLF